jgi:UDP:flavonoid glycosyltransferase YjiC (YdhE family)
MASSPAAASSDGKVRTVAVVCTGQTLDVQQYVALGVALQRAAGFRVKLVTHFRYAALAAAHGLAFAGLKGDPSALVRESAFRDAVAEDSLLRVAALLKRETDATLEANLVLLHEALRQGVDAIVCSIGVLTECLAVAQRYQRPCLLAPLLPYSPSGELPLAHLMAEPAKYKFLNQLSYDVSGALLWSYCGAAFNRFRTQVLNVGPQSYYVLEGVPQVAAFASAVVPPPSDWGSWVHLTGHWELAPPAAFARDVRERCPQLCRVLEAAAAAEHPLRRPLVCELQGCPLPDAVAFLRAAHAVGAKLGVSVVVVVGEDSDLSAKASHRLADLQGVAFEIERPAAAAGPASPAAAAPAADGAEAAASPAAANAAAAAKLYAAAAAGPRSGAAASPSSLSSSSSSSSSSLSSSSLPRLVVIASAPHAWLFSRASVVVHQGSASSAQAAMAAGVPSVVFPAFGEQHFWAARVSALGVGPPAHFPLREASARLDECVGVARQPSIVAAAAQLGEQLQAAGDGALLAAMTVRDVLSRPQHRHCGVTCRWEPDGSRAACSLCARAFGLLNRRRHCRSCGRLACTFCFTQRCHLPGFPENAPQITCERCLDSRRAFFAMSVGESVVPELPAEAAGLLGASPAAAMATPAGAGAGAGAGFSARSPPLASPPLRSQAAAAAAVEGFLGVDILSPGAAGGGGGVGALSRSGGGPL